jgi:hypothetical protein
VGTKSAWENGERFSKLYWWYEILLEKLEVHQIEDKGVITEFYSSNHVKKLLKFNIDIGTYQKRLNTI